MIWPARRLWCELRVWHPTAIWASEWRYGGLERTVESRCSDCGWVRWKKTEYRSRDTIESATSASSAQREEDGR